MHVAARGPDPAAQLLVAALLRGGLCEEAHEPLERHERIAEVRHEVAFAADQSQDRVIVSLGTRRVRRKDVVGNRVDVVLRALEHVRDPIDDRLEQRDEYHVAARAAEAHLLRALRKRLERPRLVHETVRRVISAMVGDVLAETERRVRNHAPKSVDDVRSFGESLVTFSPQMLEKNRVLQTFLSRRMYAHERVLMIMERARRMIASRDSGSSR